MKLDIFQEMEGRVAKKKPDKGYYLMDEPIDISVEETPTGYQLSFFPHGLIGVWWGELHLSTAELVALKDQIEEKLREYPKAPPPGPSAGLEDIDKVPLALLAVATVIAKDPKAARAAVYLARNFLRHIGIKLF